VGVANGDIDAIELGPCGVFSTHRPFGELQMHHLAANAMRAMVKALRDDLGVARLEADNTTRTLARQIQMFDGTLPNNRTEVDGRYIPSELWHTMPDGSLDPDPRHEREWPKGTGHMWRRRKETNEAAAPGTSNHGFGLAIDIKITDQIFDWLVDNAARFGFSGETPSERNHWRYIAGDDIPPAVAGVLKPADPVRRPPRQIAEENDMKIIDLAADSPQFTRLVIAGRIKWVRGPAAAAVARLNIERIDVSRDELGALMQTFGTEGSSPFSAAREKPAADADLDDLWQASLA
jgi:hypothetical protein